MPVLPLPFMQLLKASVLSLKFLISSAKHIFKESVEREWEKNESGCEWASKQQGIYTKCRLLASQKACNIQTYIQIRVRGNSLTLTLLQIHHLPECLWINRGRSSASRCVKLHMFSKKASKRVDRTGLMEIIQREHKLQFHSLIESINTACF